MEARRKSRRCRGCTFRMVKKDPIKNCFLACRFKSEESQEIATTSVGKEEFDKDFLQYVEIDENRPTSNEISDTEIVEQFLSSQVSSRPVSDDEDSDVDEEPDPPSTAADARKALHTLRRILENRGA